MTRVLLMGILAGAEKVAIILWQRDMQFSCHGPHTAVRSEATCAGTTFHTAFHRCVLLCGVTAFGGAA